MSVSKYIQSGFALPMVLISSVVMMLVLLAGVQTVVSLTVAIDNERYVEMAREAAESGIKMAETCIEQGSTSWIGTATLYPKEDSTNNCNVTSQCTTAQCYIVNSSTERTTYAVSGSVSANGTYTISAVGTYQAIKPDGSTIAFTVDATFNIKYTLDQNTKARVSDSGHAQVCAILKLAGSTKDEAYCWGQNDDARAGIGARNSGDSYCDGVQNITYVARREADDAGAPLNSCEPIYRKVKDDMLQNTVTLADNTTSTRTRTFRDHEIDISSGQGFACAISTNAAGLNTINSNRVYCWGDDYQGRLGQGLKVKPGVSSPGCPVSPSDSTVAQCHTPVAVKFSPWENDGYYPVDIATGIDFACVLVKQFYTDGAGRVYCWGHNNKGQLGRGSASAGTVFSADPQPVINYTDNAGSMLSVKSLFIGLGRTACAISGTYTARCWGENNFGQVGNAQVGTHAYYPQSIIDQSNNQLFASKIAPSGSFYADSADSGHTCAITKNMPGASDGSIYCWGRNKSGEVGTGTPGTSNWARARQVSTIYNTAGGTAWSTNLEALDIATAHMTSCATIKTISTNTTKVYCWGKGNTLGVGQIPPCPNPGPDPYNTYLNLQCWADIPADAQTVRAKPAPIDWSGAAPTSIVGGGQRFCMIVALSNYCWGANNAGQIGDGTTTYRSKPTLSKFLEVPGDKVYF